MICLAFTPFIDPIPALFPEMSNYWLWLAVPLVVAICVVYKCTRIASLRRLPRDATIMSLQILLVMLFAGFVLAAGYWAYIRIPFTRW